MFSQMDAEANASEKKLSLSPKTKLFLYVFKKKIYIRTRHEKKFSYVKKCVFSTKGGVVSCDMVNNVGEALFSCCFSVERFSFPAAKKYLREQRSPKSGTELGVTLRQAV